MASLLEETQHKQVKKQEQELHEKLEAKPLSDYPLTKQQEEDAYTSPTTKYNVYDASGNVVDTVSGSKDVFEAYRAGKTAIKDASGKYNFVDTTANVSIDPSSGNVKIRASGGTLDRLKNAGGNYEKIRNELTALSQAYKLNPDYKFPDPSDDSKSISIQNRLDEINEMLNGTEDTPGLVAHNNALDTSKRIAKEQDGVELSDEQVVKMWSVAATGDDGSKPKNDARQSLPDIPEVRKLLEGKGSLFDEGSHTISYKDLSEEVWNRDKTSDEDIRAVKQAVADYFEKKDFSDTNKYAEMRAFQEFINKESPYTSVLRGTADVVTNLGVAIATGAAELISTPLMLVDAGLDAVAGTIEGIATNRVVDGSKSEYRSMLNWINPIFAASDLGTQAFDSLEEYKKYQYETNTELGAMAGNVAFFVGAEAVPFVADVVIGSKGGAAAAKLSSKALAKAAAKAIEKEEDVASLVARTLVDPAIATPENLINGQRIFQALQRPEDAASSITKVASTLEKPVTTVADLGVQSMVDAALFEPEVLRDAIRGKGDPANVLWTEFAWNAGAFGGLVLAGRTATKFGQTTMGKTLGAVATTKINGFQANLGNLNAKIKTAVLNEDYLDRIARKAKAAQPGTTRASRLAMKEQVGKLNAQLRAAQKQLGSMKVFKNAKNADEIIANVNKIREQVVNLRGLHVAIDKAKGGAMRTVRKWLNGNYSPTLGRADQRIQDITSKVIDAEKRLGWKPATGNKAVNGNRVFSQTTTNYLGATSKRAYLINKQNIVGLTKAEANELAGLDAMIKKFLDTASQELKDLAKEYVKANQEWWGAFNTMRVADGLISKEQRARYQRSGLWGNNGELYSRTQRQGEYNNYVLMRRDGKFQVGTTTELEHYKPGSSDDFVDPSLVRFDEMIDTATTENARNLLYWGQRATGIKGEVKLGGVQTEAAKTIKELQKGFDSKLYNAQGALKDEVVGKELFDKFFRRGVARRKKAETAGEASQRAEQVARVSVIRKAAPTLGDQKAAVDAFSDASIRKLSGEVYGQSFDEMLAACAQDSSNAGKIFDEYYNSLDKKTREYVDNEVKSFQENALTGQLTIFDLAATKAATNYENIVEIQKVYPEFINSVNSQIVKNNMVTSLKTADPRIKAKAEAVRRDQITYEVRALHKEAIEKYNKAAKDADLAGMPAEELIGEMDNILDDIVDTIKKDGVAEEAIKSLQALAKDVELDDVAEYVILQSLHSKKGLDSIKKSVDAYISREQKLLKQVGFSSKGLDDSADAFKDIFYTHLEERFNNARLRLSDTPLVDKGEWMDEIRSIQREITKLSSGEESKNIVQTLDDKGREIFVETDPLLADLVTTRPIPEPSNLFGNVNYVWSKLFRLGKTGLNIKSWVNQTFRDTMNLFIGGNAWRGFKASLDDIADVVGRDVETFLREFTPEERRAIEALSEETGESLERTIARRELAMGESMSPAATETEAYRFTTETKMARYREGADGVLTSDETRLERFGDALDNITTPNGKWYNVFSWNQVREQKLRKLAYDNGFANALQEGYSIKDARVIAEQLMQDSTTNFSRRMYHLSNLQKTVPYLGAAVNGTKSFYRLWSLDPVGVTTRLFGGLVAPVMFFTAQSLGDPKNRELYKNIPEYAKAENFIMVVDGNVITIPFPQELRGIVAPFRQMVEHAYDADPATFWELAMSDAIGFSPVDLSGFMNLDANKILGDVSWVDRLWNGVNKASAQVMPPYLKSVVMAMTGVDPYTGAEIDRTRVYTDPETGESQVMDYTSGRFARWVASIFGDAVSAPMAQKILDNIIGTAGIDVLDSLSAAASAVVEGEASNLLEIPSTYLTRISEPAYQPTYNSEANTMWQRGVSVLEKEKEGIINSEEYQSKMQQLNSYNTTEKAKQQIRADLKNMLDPFYEKVKTMTERLTTEYDGVYDRKKFAQTLALMNFGQDDYSTAQTTYGASLSDDEKELARAQAIQTMQNMGFRSTNDTSIFGYYGRNSGTGEIEVRYMKPLAMQSYDLTSYSGPGGLVNKIHLANIKAEIDNYRTASGDKLTDLRKEAKAAANKIYEQSGLSYSQKLAAQDEVRIAYNAQVMKALAPYIKEMTPEAALNNEELMDYLEDYILVPNSYEKNNKGKSPSLGSRGNKQSAYVENYIRYIFDIKDIYGRGSK